MASKIKVDQLETADGSGTIALQNQLSGMTTASLPTVTTDKLGAGAVVQVGMSGTTSETSTSSTSWSDAGTFINFTPTSSSNKVLVSFSQPVKFSGGGSALRGAVRLKRVVGGVATVVWNSANFTELCQVRGTPAEVNMVVSGVYFDSPSTTNQVEYRIQLYAHEGTFRTYASTYGAHIVCQEIKQ
jgi:hypothetical protein